MKEAQARAKRYETLVKIEAVSQQDYDKASADLHSAQAATRSAQADLETARLNLGYTSVIAPISGRVGRALVTEGALVGQGEATPDGAHPAVGPDLRRFHPDRRRCVAST